MAGSSKDSEPALDEVRRALEWTLNTQPRRRDGKRAANEDLAVLRRLSLARAGCDANPDLEVAINRVHQFLADHVDDLPNDDRDVARILMAHQTPVGERTRQIAELRSCSVSTARSFRDQAMVRMAALIVGQSPKNVTASPDAAGNTETRRFRAMVAIGAIGVVATVASPFLFNAVFGDSDGQADVTPSVMSEVPTSATEPGGPDVPSPNDLGPEEFPTAIVLGEQAINVRAAPNVDSSIVGTIPVGNRVVLRCHIRGQLVTYDSTDEGTDLWHLITPELDGEPLGYATDAFLDTGSVGEPPSDEPTCE